MLVLMVPAVKIMLSMYCFLMSPPSLFFPHPWELQSGEAPNRLTTWTVACPKRSMGVDQWWVGLQYHDITYCAWWVTCQLLMNLILEDHVHLVVQTLYPESGAMYQDDNAPIHTSRPVSGLLNLKVKLNLSMACTITRFKYWDILGYFKGTSQ